MTQKQQTQIDANATAVLEGGHHREETLRAAEHLLIHSHQPRVDLALLRLLEMVHGPHAHPAAVIISKWAVRGVPAFWAHRFREALTPRVLDAVKDPDAKYLLERALEDCDRPADAPQELQEHAPDLDEWEHYRK